jgi:hypothetical protein
MASKYEEMRGVEETARKNWVAHRERCRQYMASLVVGMLRYCGIPDDRVRYLRWNEEEGHYSEPEQGQYLLPGAMVFDDAGDCRLGVCIVFTPRGTFPERWASFGLFVSEQGGKVLAQLGPDKPVPIDLKNQDECNEFYDGIVNRIKQSFTEPQKPGAESIGFKRSPLATDQENQPPKSANVA